jgi:subtilase family serine protease
MRALRRLFLVAVLVALSGCAPLAEQAPDRVPPAAPVNAAPVADDAAPVELGRTPADEQIRFSVSLRLPGAAELDDYLAGLSRPGSASYRRFLAPADFGARFGLADQDLDRIMGWLRDAGLQATALPQRTSVEVSGTAGQVNRLLDVTMVDRRNAGGIRYHEPDGEPAVPSELASDVAAIIGLDTEPVIEPAYGGGMLFAGVPQTGLMPDTVATAYEIDPLHAAGLDGKGMTIGIVSFDTFTASDVDRFDQREGITGAPDVEIVRLPGAVEEPGHGAGEVALDIQVIRGIAPQAQIIDYEGANTADGFVPIIARIVADARAQIVSISWGTCENRNIRSAMAAEQRELAAAYAAGISIFVASGDDGAYDCRRIQISDNLFDRDLSPGVDWPAASPNVIAVGGTFLTVREDGTYFDEAGWEEPLGGGGGGGGLSKNQDRPDWQAGAGVDNSQSNGKRQVPDVAGPADPLSGFYVEYTEPDQGVVSGRVGGTSAAAPLWASSMLLAQQLAQGQGIATLGPLAPVLYQIAAEQPAGAVFHDVIKGGNLLYEAGPGWDYSTGLGSPRVAPLARAIIDFLQR